MQQQRRIVLDSVPPLVEDGSTSEKDLQTLDQLLARNAEYLPLELYLRRRQLSLAEDETLEQARRRVVLACWEARVPVKRIAHSRLVSLPVFPVTVLDALYSRELATVLEEGS